MFPGYNWPDPGWEKLIVRGSNDCQLVLFSSTRKQLYSHMTMHVLVFNKELQNRMKHLG